MKNLKDVEVLITVGDPYVVSDIKVRLDNMHIDRYYVLTEVLPKWGENEALPERLSFTTKEKKIVLFNTPEHDNIGDHLIAVSSMDVLKNLFSDKRIYEISDIDYLWYGGKIRSNITSEDIILIAGGGFLGSLWLYNGESNVRSIIMEYPQNKIVILPQTLYFEDSIRGEMEYKKSSEIYQSHNDLVLCTRDYKSEQLGKQLMKLPDNVKLLPDMALFYERFNNQESIPKTNKVLVCLRKDKEGVLKQTDKDIIYSVLNKMGYEIEETSMHASMVFGKDSRESIVAKKLRELSQARIVVTDTLHCMVSSALAGTACIAFDNISGKVSGVYQWIKSLEYIRICESADEFEHMLIEIPKEKNEYCLQEKQKYIDTIKQIIGEEKDDST